MSTKQESIIAALTDALIEELCGAISESDLLGLAWDDDDGETGREEFREEVRVRFGAQIETHVRSLAKALREEVNANDSKGDGKAKRADEQGSPRRAGAPRRGR